MKKKISLLLLVLSIALALVSTVVLVLSAFGAVNYTKIRADLTGVSSVYADDAAEELYSYAGNLTRRTYEDELLTEYTFGEQTDVRVSAVEKIGGMLYVSLLDERKIVTFDAETGEHGKVYNILDPIKSFTLSEDGSYLAVASENKNKTYITLLETADGKSWVEDTGAQTPYLCEINSPAAAVALYFEGDSLIYALKNGDIYSVRLDGVYEEQRVYRTELTLVAYGRTKNGDSVAVSDKGIVMQYRDGEAIAQLQLSGDVYCASVCVGSDIVAVGMRYDAMRFYSAQEQKIVASVSVYNEPSKIERSAASADRIFMYESLSGSGKLLDLENVKSLQTYAILKTVSIVTEVIFVLFLVFSVINISCLGGRQLSLFKKIGKAFWAHKKSYLMLLPSFVLLGIFNYFPAIWSFFLSLTEYKPGVYTRFVGLENFAAMFENEYFWAGMQNMIIFLVTDILKVLIPPLIIAELIFAMRSQKAQYWTRVLMYIPGILPGVAGVMIWTSGILGMDGLINVFLRTVGLGNLATDWLGTSETAIWALVFIGFPYIGGYLLFYGAIMSVPKELFEAAKLDGCNWWQRIVFIDMPLISPQLKYVFVTGFIGSIQDFGRVWLTTGGGPGYSTYIPALELYNNISQFNNYGMAAAMGVFLFVIILIITIFNMKIKTQSAVGV